MVKFMEEKKNLVQYFLQIIYAHIIIYFIVGMFSLVVMNYRDLYAMEIISSFR